MDETASARALWWLVETCHAAVYFAPESKPAYERAGLKGGWMGYFASRSAALGATPAEVVIATFYNFAPRMVRRALPDAWRYSTPERVLAARREVVDAAFRRILGDGALGDGVARAASTLEPLARACPLAGRPLFAAHAALPWPVEPHLRLWHACTLLREFRGDGHVAALVAAGLDGVEAHVSACAAGASARAAIEPFRGWGDGDWAAAYDRLRARGLVTADGDATDAGRALRADVERRTDELFEAPLRAAGNDAARRARDALEPVARAIAARGGVPFPNPIGLPNVAALP